MKIKPICKAGVCCCAASGLFASAISAKSDEQDALRLAPSSPWQMNYADDSCRIARAFGEGKRRVIFYIERYEPGDTFTMLAAGSVLKERRKRDFAYVTFGAEEAEARLDVIRGNLGDIQPALIFNSVRLAAPATSDIAHDRKNMPKPDIFGGSLSPQREQAITWIRFRPVGRAPVYLETGSLGAPMEAMRTCTDDLLTRWGIDLEKHKNLARRPKPTSSPGRWLSSQDYPSGLLRKGAQGIVKFRLSVDSSGMPTGCFIQQSTRPKGFDDAVCKALIHKARFEPALTADGESIASYWRNTVRFVIPG